MSVKEGVKSILENNLDKMREEFSKTLTAKAMTQLEEKKVKIASQYFGQK